MKAKPLAALFAVTMSSLSACGGSGGSSSAPPSDALSMEDAQYKGLRQSIAREEPLPLRHGRALADLTFRFQEEGQDVAFEDGAYHFKHGRLTLDQEAETFHFLPLDTHDSIVTVQVSDGTSTASATWSFTDIAGDPLFLQQWHLKNSGQKAYSQNPEGIEAAVQWSMDFFGDTEEEARSAYFIDESILVPGEDLNLSETLAANITGKGIIVLVADSGLELNHEDMADNIVPGASLNFAFNGVYDEDSNSYYYPSTFDPTDPTNASPYGDHGTSVAGLIAARGWNGLGGRGVAPDARLIGMNFLLVQTTTSQILVNGFPGSVGTQADIINKSYGLDLPFQDILFDAMQATILSYPPLHGRDGKGTVVVKAAGNGFAYDYTEYSPCKALGALALGVTCQNTSFETDHTFPYQIVVGAVNSDGRHTSYSSAGASLFLSAPAGEYGHSMPAMITTDQSTCLKGYSSFPYLEDAWVPGFPAALLYPFNNPGHPDNINCNYIATFNGTSSAAPNTSGAVALLLSANPDLTWRDVRHILASTADQVDPGAPAAILTVGGAPYIARDAWITNAAGYPFNNLYGFGRVNVDAAMAMATDHYTALPPMRETEWRDAIDAPLEIPDNDIVGATAHLNIDDDLTVETVQLRFTLTNDDLITEAYDTDAGFDFEGSTLGPDTAIELISPSGTRSVLLNPRSGLTLSYDTVVGESPEHHFTKDMILGSNAFYGENAKGTWTLKILDTNGDDVPFSNKVFDNAILRNNTENSNLEHWGLRFFGHAQ